jgi:hypothetical protein
VTEVRDPLPEKVRQLAARLGCDRATSLRHVCSRQTGQMRESADLAWKKFGARQRIDLTACGFEWKARMGPLGAIHVNDTFSDGSGHLAVKLFGVFKIAGAAKSLSLDRGELMRYLAELAWAPDAIMRNRTLRWRELDDGRLSVSTGDGEQRAEIQITLDEEGRIAEVFAPDRPRAVGDRFEPSAWRGTFGDYCWTERRLVPMSAEVGWFKESAYEAVWRGRLIEWSAV